MADQLSRDVRLRKARRSSLSFGDERTVYAKEKGRTVSFFPAPKVSGSADGWLAQGRQAGGDAQWGVGRLDGFPASAETKLRGVGIKHTKRQAGSAQRGRTRLHGKTHGRSPAGRRARCSVWGKADARAQSNAEARARVHRVGVMRAGPEQARVEAQPTHCLQQGGSAGLPQQLRG